MGGGPGVSLASRCCSKTECWLGSLVIFQGEGVHTSFPNNTFIFVISKTCVGQGFQSSLPHLDPRMNLTHDFFVGLYHVLRCRSLVYQEALVAFWA